MILGHENKDMAQMNTFMRLAISFHRTEELAGTMPSTTIQPIINRQFVISKTFMEVLLKMTFC